MAKSEVRYEDVRQGPTWTLTPDKANQRIRVEINFDGIDLKDLREEDYRCYVPKDTWKSMLARLG